MNSYKKISLILSILILFMSSVTAVSALEDNNMDLDIISNSDEFMLSDVNSEIYVSNSGDGDIHDGSISSPYSNLNDAISIASENSTIILLDGEFKGVSNSEININKNLTIKSLNSTVIINGENKYHFFNILSGGSLTIENIDFINGYANLNSNQLGIFTNRGSLTLNNVNIKNMEGFMGLIYNYGNLNICNSNFDKCSATTLAQILVNLENATIINTTMARFANDNLDLTVYNYKNLIINNSNIYSITSSLTYDEDSAHKLSMIVDNSVLQSVEFHDGEAKITNSQIINRLRLHDSQTLLDKVQVSSSSYEYSVSSFGGNLTVISSVINHGINAPNSKVYITYSVILGGITGNGGASEVYAPLNWWGSNYGPQISYAKINATNWVVMSFDANESPIQVGTNAKFTVSLNKITSNDVLSDLENVDLLPNRYVYFESESGNFEKNGGYINNGIFENYLINNTENSLVYAVVDSQRLRLVIGTGSSNYSLYVSQSRGNNALGDGSFENPYNTIQFALNKAFNGNTIYLIDGNFSYSANSNLVISKNVTLEGLGDIVLKRDDNRNIFQITSIGNLIVKNINFTLLSSVYSNPLFSLNGGNLTVKNSNFYDIYSTAIIYSSSNSKVIIDSCNFSNIHGSVSEGSSKLFVYNSTFEKLTKYYENSIYYDYNYIFTSAGLIEVYDSLFRNNDLAIVNLHPMILTAAQDSQYMEYSRYAYFRNSSFINNNFKNLPYPYTVFKMYDVHSSFYGFIENCSFVDNIGLKISLNTLNSSTFINNQNFLLSSVDVVNSIFKQNTNLVRDGVAYTGNGILNSNRVINSTFISNKAAYGGALYNPSVVHYSVFVNNTAQYEGNDIFSYSGNVDYSSNWWGDNQKPDSNKIYIFLGELTVDDWIIMTFDNISKYSVKVSLNNLINNNGDITPLNYSINQRDAYFATDYGIVTPSVIKLQNNVADADLIYNQTDNDFNVYARIDNQLLDLSIKNNSTRILMENTSFYGKNNKYNATLINVNGYSISNQTLIIEITDENNETISFSRISDENGFFEFLFEDPIGEYVVNIFYEGNGFYEKSNNSAIVNVLPSISTLRALNYTYYGKNNDFYVVLVDSTNLGISNQTISFNITNSYGQSKFFDSITDASGRADVILSLDAGEYDIIANFNGDGWYAPSSVSSHITIFPINSTLIVPDVTFYGVGNVYNITLKDSEGTLIIGESINVIISQGTLSDTFILTTDENGIAHLTINYLPGTYNVKVNYAGDFLYGAAEDSGVITIEKVLTRLSGFSHATIPLNGIYGVVLTDMYGRRLINETITMDVYKGKLLKSYSAVSDGNGEATFILDLDESTYLVTYDYAGNTWYSESTGAATVVINNNTALSNVDLNASDLVQYYGENKYFVISFKDYNAYSQYGKNIVATISSSGYYQTFNLITDAFGQARLQINLNPGSYNITYSYKNEYYGIFAQNVSSILVYKMPSYIVASDIIMKSGETKYFEVTLLNVNNNPIRNMPVNIDISGKQYNVTTNSEGIARVLIDLDIGSYDVKYSFENPNFISSSGSSKILVSDLDKIITSVVGKDDSIYDSQTLIYNVTLKDELNNPISGSMVFVNVLDMENNILANFSSNTNSEGIATFSLNLEYGNYLLNSYYFGSSRYFESSTMNYVNVMPSANLTKTFINGSLSENNQYEINLVDEYGAYLQYAEIVFNVNNKTYFTTTDNKGKAFIDLGLIAGIYDIKAYYEGDENYERASISDKIILLGNLTYLFAFDVVKYYHNSTQFNVQLLDSFGLPMANKEIIFTVNNVNYTNMTNDEGWALFVIDFEPGNYTVVSSYVSDNPQENAFAISNVSVFSTIIANDLVKYYRNASQFNVKVLDFAGNPIKNTNVSMLFNGILYVRMTNDEGIATLEINSEVGNYNVSVQNPNDGLIQNYNIKVIPYSSLKETNISGKLVNGTYEVVLVDEDNSPIIDASLNVIVNNRTYSVVTNDEGKVMINLSSQFGVYSINVVFKGDSAHKSCEFSDYVVISGNLNYLFAYDLVKYYKNDS
ncbi:MAG: Ig-like domain-containing protein, partial [Methanobrevibacter sp.]|nr:Ig-like domain-containing protein [Methanobrevibacter sp.]